MAGNGKWGRYPARRREVAPVVVVESEPIAVPEPEPEPVEPQRPGTPQSRGPSKSYILDKYRPWDSSEAQLKPSLDAPVSANQQQDCSPRKTRARSIGLQ